MHFHFVPLLTLDFVMGCSLTLHLAMIFLLTLIPILNSELFQHGLNVDESFRGGHSGA